MRGLVAMTAVAVGCSPGAFTCEDASECIDGAVPGACQPDGFCSFPDGDCESGQRYGAHSGALSRDCVPPSGGTDGGSGSGATLSTTIDPSSTTSASATSFEESVGESDPDTTSAMTTAPGTSTGTMEDSTGQPPAGPDLALWLRFEDAAFAESIADAGPLGLQASCDADSCPAQVAGFDGNGASFSGTGECILVQHDAAFEQLTGLTVSAFVQVGPSTMLANHMAVTKPYGRENNDSFELYLYDPESVDPAMQARFAVADAVTATTVTAPDQLPAGVWTHLAGRWDGVEVTFWIDGAQVGASPQAAIGMDDHAVMIGCDADVGGEVFDNVFSGLIDEVRIYREALSAEQIAALSVGDEP